MSTKSWIGSHTGENGDPSWGLYKELFEREVVYLELTGVQVDVRMIDEKSPTVLLRLPEAPHDKLACCAQRMARRRNETGWTSPAATGDTAHRP
ncbi:hypothetical protein [Caballeronia sp. KNU42]